MPRSKNPTILDLTLRRIEIFNEANGGGVAVRKDAHGYSLFREDTGAPVARLKPLKSTGLLRDPQVGVRPLGAPRQHRRLAITPG